MLSIARVEALCNAQCRRKAAGQVEFDGLKTLSPAVGLTVNYVPVDDTSIAVGLS